MQFAEAINCTSPAIGPGRAHNRISKGIEHAYPGPRRVYSKEDIMQNDEEVKCLGLADRPWLLPSRLIVCIERLSGDCVDGSNRDGNLGV